MQQSKKGSNTIINIEENSNNNTHCNVSIFHNIQDNIQKIQFYLTRILYDLFAQFYHIFISL
jgi:hypothetical protein